MANSSNAYATERPLQTSIVDWVAKNDQMDMARRQEQREIEQIAQAKKDKTNALYESRRSKFKPLTIESTGVKSTDQILSRILLKGIEEKHKLEGQLNPNMSYEEYADLSAKIAGIEDLPNKLKLSQDAFVTEAKSYQKLMADGTIKKDPALLKKLQSFSDGYFDVELDENYNPMIGLWDKDKDGKPDILSYDQIIAGQTFGEPTLDLDFNKEFLALGEKVGTKTDANDNGFRKTTRKYTPTELNKLTAISNLYDEQGGFTPLAKSRLYDLGFKDYTKVPQKIKEQLEQDAIDVMRTVQEDTKTNDFDYGAAETKKQNKISNKRADKKEEQETVSGNVVEIPQSYNTDKTKTLPGYKAIALGGPPVVMPAFEYRLGGKKTVVSDAQIQTWSVGTNSKGQRQIVAQIAYDKVKGTKTKGQPVIDEETGEEIEGPTTVTQGAEREIITIPLSEAQAEAFRIGLSKKGMKFKNVNAMKDAARSSEKVDEYGVPIN